MITVLDIETTSNGPGRSPSFYWPENDLVSVGLVTDKWRREVHFEQYLCFKHNTETMSEDAERDLKRVLKATTLLVGHNIKFDLLWLLSCGFKYEGTTYDTMIYEYLRAGSRPNFKRDLSSCCRRYGLPVKTDEAGQLFAEGYGYEEMPWEVVEEYGRNDVDITRQLYEAQQCTAQAHGDSNLEGGVIVRR